ncbi:MAG TPA: hypothetical protein VLG38_04790 [Gammaproteobacteria bacterium]|nr:hypothetical protein [Gammaproteobacteria bacterium]
MAYLLWQHKTKHHHPQKPPSPPPTPNTDPYTLKQGHSAYINTSGITKNGSVVIDFPGCSTVTLYHDFNSNAAQKVWNANQGSNPLFAPNPPVHPNTSSLMVVANSDGQVETMTPFPMNTQFKITNVAIAEGSEYFISCIEQGAKYPDTYLDLKSPDTSVIIPGNVYGGVAQASELQSTKRMQFTS